MSFPYLYLPKHFAAEKELAVLLMRLARTQVDPIPGWENYADGLDKSQVFALESAMRNALTMIYGLPGSGKTTVIRRIIQAFDNAGMTGIVVAPTGKAAKRANEVIYEIQDKLNSVPPCKTTYRGLEYNPARGGFIRNFRNPFDLDYVIADEWGFVGLIHSRDFLLAINPKRTRLIVVGDPYQLPSVEAGNVYKDMINSHKFAASELTEVHRTGANSGIAVNASFILKGESPIKIDPCTGEKFTDWKFIITESEDATRNLIVKLVVEDLPKYFGVNSTTDVQVISPGKAGEVGTRKLNQVLHEKLNPGKPRFRGFRLGDKVINRKNSYQLEIFNGDGGIINGISDSDMTIDFGAGSGIGGAGTPIIIDNQHADNIHLNYCQTVHSSQGSEYKIVIMPLHRSHFRLLSRNLLYTGMTRAKQCVVLVGDASALQQCLRHSETMTRTTGLRNWLDNIA